MANKSIKIVIETDGHTTVEANNFRGQGCAAATEAIELALAGSDPGNRDDRKKPDWYQSITPTQSNTN